MWRDRGDRERCVLSPQKTHQLHCVWETNTHPHYENDARDILEHRTLVGACPGIPPCVRHWRASSLTELPSPSVHMRTPSGFVIEICCDPETSVYNPAFETTTMVACSESIRANARRRHRSHSTYARPSDGLRTDTIAEGQADLVSDTRRQRLRAATCSSAGNHCAACESPNSTSVVSLATAP
ncbi:MAG: hypothetical protein JWM95_599 [Gemmatimonadetes bacterium]|nr:hypothetical protein [Gemmatimonadota bacterium]